MNAASLALMVIAVAALMAAPNAGSAQHAVLGSYTHAVSASNVTFARSTSPVSVSHDSGQGSTIPVAAPPSNRAQTPTSVTQSTGRASPLPATPPVALAADDAPGPGLLPPFLGLTACSGSTEDLYYVGNLYSSSRPTIDATELQTTLPIPSNGPEEGFSYYQVLTVWDSGGHYDWLGYAADCGSWVQIAMFSSASALSGYSCVASGSIYYCGWTGMPISEGTSYTYAIFAEGSGLLEFQISTGGIDGNVVWGRSVTLSGANSLVVSNGYTGGIGCGNGNTCIDYGTLEYLQYYSGSNSRSSYDVFYANNEYGVSGSWSGTAGDWSSYTNNAPANILEQASYLGTAVFNTPTSTASDTDIFFGQSSSSVDLGQTTSITFGVSDDQGVSANTQDLEILFPSFTSGQTAFCSGSGSTSLSVMYYPSGSSGLVGGYSYLTGLTAPYGFANAVASSPVPQGASYSLTCSVTPTASGSFTYDLESPMGFYAGGVYGGGEGWIHWPAPLPTSNYVTDFKSEVGIPFTLTVNPDPTVSVSPSGPFTYVLGQSATSLTATVEYSGENSASVSWYSSSNSACSQSSTSTGTGGTTFTPSTSNIGTRYYCAVVSDSGVLGFVASSNPVEVTVGPQLAVATPSASVNPIDIGATTEISTTGASGGAGSYSYAWSGLPDGCTGTGTSFPCAPTANHGSPYTVKVIVTDAQQRTASSSFLLYVNAPLTVGVPSATQNPVMVGQPTVISTTGGSGGSGGYSYAWTGLPSPCSGSGTSFRCVPNEATGSPFTVGVTVEDSQGKTAQETFPLTVTSVPAAELTTLVVPDPDATTSGTYNVIVTALDSAGQPVVGAPISFTNPAGSQIADQTTSTDTFGAATEQLSIPSSDTGPSIGIDLTGYGPISLPTPVDQTSSSSGGMELPANLQVDDLSGGGTVTPVRITDSCASPYTSSTIIENTGCTPTSGPNNLLGLGCGAYQVYDQATSIAACATSGGLFASVLLCPFTFEALGGFCDVALAVGADALDNGDLQTCFEFITGAIGQAVTNQPVPVEAAFPDESVGDLASVGCDVLAGTSTPGASSTVTTLTLPDGSASAVIPAHTVVTGQTGLSTYSLSRVPVNALPGADVSEPPLLPLDSTQQLDVSRAAFEPNPASPVAVAFLDGVENGTLNNSVALSVAVPSALLGPVSLIDLTTNTSFEATIAGGMAKASVDEAGVFVVVQDSPITFTESGLPSGSSWTVTLGGTPGKSTTTVIGFLAPNGTYAYVATPVAGYTVSPNSGTVTVSGSSVNVNVVFTRVTYTVTFTESGLPSGTLWTVTLSGTPNTNTGNTLQFTEPNATYGYAVTPIAGYTVSPNSGNVVVNGADVEVDLAFIQGTYSVVFTESGLPSGTSWTVTLAGTPALSATSTIKFSEPNGSYGYTVSPSAGYTVSPHTGSVTVNGATVSVDVRYTVVENAVTFTVSSGLPAGKPWLVMLNGTGQGTYGMSSVSFNEPNGTYEYMILGPSGHLVTGVAASGNLTVSGPQTVTFSFVRGATHAIKFAESGLPKSAGVVERWCLEIQGVVGCRTTASAKLTGLSPGWYSYTIEPVNGQTITAKVGTTPVTLTGYLHVTTKNEVVSVRFVYYYQLTFTESGVTAGSWSVMVRGVTETAAAGSRIVFNEPNGTYAYQIGAETGYKSTGTPRPAVVRGANAGVTVRFVVHAVATRSLAVEPPLPAGHGSASAKVDGAGTLESIAAVLGLVAMLGAVLRLRWRDQ